MVLCIELKALRVLDKCSTTELYSQALAKTGINEMKLLSFTDVSSGLKYK